MLEIKEMKSNTNYNLLNRSEYGNNEKNIYNSNLMNGLTGMAIGITIVIIGVYMVIGINKVTKID